jgi:hypothetical protein
VARRALAVLALVLLVGSTAAAQDRVPPLRRPRPAPRLVAPFEPPERPAYALGQKWILADGTYELKRLDGRDYVFVGPGREIRLTPDLAVSGVRRGSDYVDFRQPPRLRWPLRPGLWGSGESRWRVSRLPRPVAGLTPGPDVRITWQVRAPEEVTVPAGRFLAWRIDYEVGQIGAVGLATTVWQFDVVRAGGEAARQGGGRRRGPARVRARGNRHGHAATGRRDRAPHRDPATRRAAGRHGARAERAISGRAAVGARAAARRHA